MMKNSSLNRLIKVSVLSAVSFLLMALIEIPLPIFPEFLKLDISDIPAIFGAFAMGPLEGVAIEALKNVLHAVLKPGTAGIGELANFIVGSGYVYVAGLIYMRKKDRKHALLGIVAGIAAMSALAAAGNYFIFLPLYEKVLGFKIAFAVGAASKVNPAVKDLNTLIVLSIIPFNVLKGLIESAIVFFSYKKLSPILHK
jgi:riboflavin transporter FmnP